MKIANTPILPRREQIRGFFVGLVAGFATGFVIALITNVSIGVVLILSVLGGVIGQGFAIQSEETQNELDLENEIVFTSAKYIVHSIVGAASSFVVVVLFFFAGKVWPSIIIDPLWGWLGVTLGAFAGLIVGFTKRP